MCTLRDFTDKVVLVTGSTSGIGLAVAKYFAQCGANVVITGRNDSRLEKAGQECEALSPKRYKPLLVKGDVTNENDCKRLITATIDQFGKLDVLVNNAGSGTMSSIYDPKMIDTLQNMLDVNLKSVARMTNLAVTHLEKTGGVVVNVSSTVAVRPYPTFMPYCVAKAGLDMFTRCVALELGPKGVRVNSVNPTAVRTNFQAASNASDAFESVIAHLENVNPLRRIATTEDVVNAIAFLSSNDSSFVTGHSLVVDGGSIYV